MTFLYRDVIEWLEREIQGGRLHEGDRLPTELELGDKFGVSRITIKRAMEELQQRELVTRYRGRGTFVAQGASRRVASDPAERVSSPEMPAERPSTMRRIGFVAPELSDLFGVKMLNGIDNRCQELGYELSIARSRGSMSSEAEIIERWRRAGIDAIIVFPVHREFYNETLIRAVLDRFPVVLVDRTLRGLPVASVLTNHYEASVALTSWMLDQGHTSLAFISPPSVGTSSLEDRHRGFIDTLESRSDTQLKPGYRLFLESVVPGRSSAEAFQQSQLLLRKFLASQMDITGIVASEYALALLAQRVIRHDPALADRSIRIACFDALTNYPSAESFPHILQDESAIGATAVDLVARLFNGDSLSGKFYIDYRLVTFPDHQTSATSY